MRSTDMPQESADSARAPEQGFKEGRRTALLVTTSAGLEGEARREVRRLLPGAEARSLFLKGNLLVLSDLAEEEAVARLGETETELVARVTPVQASAPLSEEASCFPQVAAAAAGIGRIGPGQLFLVRCSRRGSHQWSGREMERAVALMLEKATGGVGEYEQSVHWVVSIEAYQGIAYLGVNRPPQLLRKPLQRQRKYAPGERPLNRAQWKIKEALATFGIALPAGARVLDLGSAPGGWALALAEMGCQVVAVDPAELDAAVAGHPNVSHLRVRAEEVVTDEDWRGGFDLLTCDMNVDPREAAEVVCALAPVLKPGGTAIMTVKYTTRARRRHETEARAVLGQAYEDVSMRRLPHNARETTAVMRRRGSLEGAPK